MIPCLLIIGNLMINLNKYHNCSEQFAKENFTSCFYYNGGTTHTLNLYGLPFNTFKSEVKNQCGKLK